MEVTAKGDIVYSEVVRENVCKLEAYVEEMASGDTISGSVNIQKVQDDMLKHYHIGVSEKNHLHIGIFLSKNAGDPAIQVWIMQESCSVTLLTPSFYFILFIFWRTFCLN